MTVTVKDHGANQMLRRLRGTSVEVDVGIDSDQGHPATVDGLPSIDALALIHEFGAGRIPARSFIRGWVDERGEFIRWMLTAAGTQIIGGTRALVDVAKELGAELTGDCLERFDAGIAPPLAESTVARKGHDTILVETGTLRAALSYLATVKTRGAR